MTERNAVPLLWRDEAVVIAGCGESLTREQLDYCRGRVPVVVINNAWELAPWAAALYACDAKWWDAYEPAFKGLRFTQAHREGPERPRELETADRHGAAAIDGMHGRGLSLSRDLLHYGAYEHDGELIRHGCSGFQALNLAALAGASRILLLGFDMRGGHFFGAHKKPLSNPDNSHFARWSLTFAAAIPDLARLGAEVINCTPGSALGCFPKAQLEDVI